MTEMRSTPSAERKGDRSGPELGRAFAEALAVKDFPRTTEILDTDVDFRALTPNRAWEASSATAVAAGILPLWFEESDSIEELISFDTESLADRERVAYRFRVRNDDGDFVVEQQAYFAAANGRITWIRVLCSGFRPL